MPSKRPDPVKPMTGDEPFTRYFHNLNEETAVNIIASEKVRISIISYPNNNPENPDAVELGGSWSVSAVHDATKWTGDRDAPAQWPD